MAGSGLNFSNMPLKACLLIKPLSVYSNETVDNFRSHKHRLELASCSCSPRWSSHPMIMSNSTHDASAILLIDFWPNIQPNLYLFAALVTLLKRAKIAVFRSVRNSHGQISVADLEQMTKHKRVFGHTYNFFHENQTFLNLVCSVTVRVF